MKITSQWCNNTNRIYYHGSRYGIDAAKSNFGCFFVTINPVYALMYAKDETCEKFNEFYLMHFKRSLNIFNIKSSKDLQMLSRLVIREKKYGYLQMFELMKTRDWLSLLRGYRAEVIGMIKNLGYDGFFNYEVDHFTLSKKEPHLTFEHYPAIGLFNIDDVTMTAVDPFSLDEIKTRKIEEERALKEAAFKFYKRKIPCEVADEYFSEETDPLFPESFCFAALTLSEVKNIVFEVYQNPDSTEKYLLQNGSINMREAILNNGYCDELRFGRPRRMW